MSDTFYPPLIIHSGVGRSGDRAFWESPDRLFIALPRSAFPGRDVTTLEQTPHRALNRTTSAASAHRER